MEREGPHRRQHERSGFPSIPVPPARRAHPDITTNIQSASRSQDLEDVDRYRQSRYITSQPPASTAIPVNANTQDITSFGPFSTAQSYSSTQMHGHGVPYQYQPEYTQDPQRQQTFQQQYTPQVMYSTQQEPQQTPYDPVVQYQTRQSISSDVLPNQFGDSQFFSPNAAGSTSASTNVPAQFPTASYQQPVQYTPQAEVERPSIVSQYPDTQSDFVQPETPTVADPIQQQADRYDVLFNQYRRALRETNDNASRGRLVQAGESLLEISEWLLGNAEGLGRFDISTHELDLTVNRTYERQPSNSSRAIEALERLQLLLARLSHTPTGRYQENAGNGARSAPGPERALEGSASEPWRRTYQAL